MAFVFQPPKYAMFIKSLLLCMFSKQEAHSKAQH